MFLPPKTKFRKQHRGHLRGNSTSNQLVFGEFGLQALEPVWLKSNQIESARRSIIKHVRKTGKLWVRVFPNKPISARAVETRMGSGKGTISYWAAVVRPGVVLFEIKGLSKDSIYDIFRIASSKLPIKTKIIQKFL